MNAVVELLNEAARAAEQSKFEEAKSIVNRVPTRLIQSLSVLDRDHALAALERGEHDQAAFFIDRVAEALL